MFETFGNTGLEHFVVVSCRYTLWKVFDLAHDVFFPISSNFGDQFLFLLVPIKL